MLVSGVHLKDSPNFHFVPQDCDDLTMQDVTITAPERAPNTDALDPSGHLDVFHSLTIDVGDDNFALMMHWRSWMGRRRVRTFSSRIARSSTGTGCPLAGSRRAGWRTWWCGTARLRTPTRGFDEENRGYGGWCGTCITRT